MGVEVNCVFWCVSKVSSLILLLAYMLCYFAIVVLRRIQSMLENPNFDESLVPDIADLYKTDRVKYEAMQTPVQPILAVTGFNLSSTQTGCISPFANGPIGESISVTGCADVGITTVFSNANCLSPAVSFSSNIVCFQSTTFSSFTVQGC